MLVSHWWPSSTRHIINRRWRRAEHVYYQFQSGLCSDLEGQARVDWLKCPHQPFASSSYY